VKFLPITWTDECEGMFCYRGMVFNLKFEIIYDENGVPIKAEIDYCCNTHMSVEMNGDRGSYVKWGGYPHFKQGEVVPISDDGRKYEYICTVDNGWGDSGTCNLFILFSKNEVWPGPEIEDVYLEYSCS